MPSIHAMPRPTPSAGPTRTPRSRFARARAGMGLSSLSPAGIEPNDIPTVTGGAVGFAHITAAFDAASAAAVAHGRHDAIVLEPMLCAAATFLSVFDALGSAVLTQLVATDFRWRTSAVRSAMARLGKDEGLELFKAERASPPGYFDSSGIDGMHWMRRVLAFVDLLVLRLLSEKDVELNEATIAAYRETLGSKHRAVKKVMVENALQLLPGKTTFIHNLFGIKDPTEAQMADIESGMREFRASVRPHIDAFDAVFEEK